MSIESAAPWLRNLPKHWSVVRLRRTIASTKNGIWGEEPDGLNDLPCVRVADFDRIKLTVRMPIPTIRSITQSERKGRVLQRGDLLIEKSGGGEQQPVGAVVLYPSNEAAVCSNFVARLVPSSSFDSRFLAYVHAHFYASRVNARSIKQTTGIQNLDVYSYFSEWAPVPPITEQYAVANFLDHKTAQIDELIDRKERLIDLLNKKRLATISQAVTNGLNPKAPRKPSGIGWLGEVPEHWRIVPLRRIVFRIEQGWSPTCDAQPAQSGEWGVLKAGCVNSGSLDEKENKRLPIDVEPLLSLQVRAGDVLMSRACGTISLVGSVAYVDECNSKLLLCDKIFRIHGNSFLVTPQFLAESLKTPFARAQIEQSLSGADGLANNVTQATIRRILVAVPPKNEQEEIYLYVTRIRKNINSLISRVSEAILKLRSLRSSLITAAVTGQIDVRTYKRGTPWQ
jgi:type I restriction enzyme S subunit